MNSLHKFIFLVVLAALAGGGYYYYTSIHSQQPNQAQQGGGLPVVTHTVDTSQLTEKIQAVGTLEASESAVLRTEVAGKIAAIYFSEGQPVEKHQVLLEIDNRTFAQEVERTKAAYDLARSSYERKQELHKAHAASTQVKDEAEAQLRASRAAYEEARINFEKTRIIAPFDGIIGLRKVSVGDYLNVGDSITDIVAVDPIKVQFTVPEKYFSVLEDGQKLYTSVDAWPDKKFEGILYAIDPVIDPDTRNITAKAMIPNGNLDLRPGMFAYIHLQVGTKDSAILVPEEALIPSGQGPSVMTVVEGKVKTVPVTIGVRQNAQAEVTSGLSVGDVVITAGHAKVREGMPVTVMPASQQQSKKPAGNKGAKEQQSSDSVEEKQSTPPIQPVMPKETEESAQQAPENSEKEEQNMSEDATTPDTNNSSTSKE